MESLLLVQLFVGHNTSDIADLKRGECEGRTVTASSHNPKDYAGALRTGGFSRSAGSPQEGRADGASIGIPGEIEGAGRYRNGVETTVSLALGIRGARNQPCRNQLSTLNSW